MKERLLIPTVFGQEIGVIMEGKNGISFQYNSNFEAEKFPISPLRLPYDPTRVFNYYDSMPFNGLPGIFADSIPDSFGNIALREYYKRIYGGGLFKLSPLEKLAYVGSNGIGAIEYKPAIEEKEEVYALAMDLQQYAEETKRLMQGDVETVLNALIAHPSPGGARPKAAVLWNEKDNMISLSQKPKDNYAPWIIKFEESNREDTKLEYVYMTLAKDLGIRVPEFKQIHLANEVHFATKRFDRVGEEKLHQATLGGIIHGDFMRQNACSYEEFLRITESLTQSPAETKEAFKRMVFNVIGKNCDDHLKNFSFLMDTNGEWKLSPAYDLLYSFGPVTYGEHKISINGKNSNITVHDLAQCGYGAGLEKTFMQEVIADVNACFSNLQHTLKKAEISEVLVKEIVKEVKPLNESVFPDPKVRRIKIRR